MELQNRSNESKALQSLSQSELAKQIILRNFEIASKMLPTTVQGALECPTISDLVKAIGKPQVAFAVEYEVIMMSARVNVGGNLTSSQTQFIATQLVEMFPAESIADFKICFQRGAMGAYGEIYRMDGIVLRKWMEAYLDEKYQVIEDDLMKQKDIEYRKESQKTGTGEGYELFKTWAADLAKAARTGIRTVTPADIQKEGKPKEGKGHSWKITDEEYYAARAEESKAFKVAHLAEMRKKYPHLTDEQLNKMV